MNENDIIINEEIADRSAENENAAQCEIAAAEENGAEIADGSAEEAAAEEAADDTAEAEDGADEAEKETADDAVGITDDDRLRAVTDPMFPTFAKGKRQPLDELISDFLKMTSLGAMAPKVSPMTLQTPRGSFASADYALSERQRKIAESAGMSYREYYNFLKSMK